MMLLIKGQNNIKYMIIYSRIKTKVSLKVFKT